MTAYLAHLTKRFRTAKRRAASEIYVPETDFAAVLARDVTAGLLTNTEADELAASLPRAGSLVVLRTPEATE